MISLIDNALLTDGCVYDIAKIVYYYYNDKYKNLTQKDEYKINIKLSEVFCRKFTERAKYYNQMIIETSEEGQKEFYNKCASSALKIALNLKKRNYKDKIIKELKIMFNYID